MSDGGRISDSNAAGDQFTYCGYVPPSHPSNKDPRWKLPQPATVLGDIECRGGLVEVLVEDILQAYQASTGKPYTARDYKILLGSIVRCIRTDSALKDDWDELRADAERTSCVVAEARMMHMIENDSYKGQAASLIKFVLEKRDFRYGKNNSPIDENEAAAIEELKKKFAKAVPSSG